MFLASLNSIGQNTIEDFTLSDAAINLTKQDVIYDPSYFSIDYPNGDVPSDKGVCTDVIIRAYRKIGIDLQKEVHEDMKANFSLYPKNWGLRTTDKNIDHRRVPNLMTFFKRKGAEKPITVQPMSYLPGDVVCWSLGNGLTHTGIVVNKKCHTHGLTLNTGQLFVLWVAWQLALDGLATREGSGGGSRENEGRTFGHRFFI